MCKLFEREIVIMVLTYILGTQKKGLVEMVLLSTHNACIGPTLLSGGLKIYSPFLNA